MRKHSQHHWRAPAGDWTLRVLATAATTTTTTTTTALAIPGITASNDTSHPLGPDMTPKSTLPRARSLQPRFYQLQALCGAWKRSLPP